MLRADGNPAAGATVRARGVGWTGSTAEYVVGGDGTFCLDVPRSEAPGEDMDGDGQSGVIRQLAVRVNYANQDFGTWTFDLSATAGACGGDTCAALGDVTLDDEHRSTITLCTITGQVVYSGLATGGDPGLEARTPLAGAMVFAYDTDAQDALTSCIVNNQGCEFQTETDADGQFSVKVPVLLGAEIMTYKVSEDEQQIFHGTVTTTACPAAPVVVPADFYAVSQ